MRKFTNFSNFANNYIDLTSFYVGEHVYKEWKKKPVDGLWLDSLTQCMFSVTMKWSFANVSSYWARKFRRHLDRHKTSRMTDIPQFEVPEIIVDDDMEAGPSKQRDASSMLTPSHAYTAFRPDLGLDLSQHTLAGSFGGSAVSSPSPSPRLAPHRPSNSGYSFDISEPGSAQHSRQGSNVSAENVMEVFSESAWGESLRRSFTQRQSREG